MNNKLIEKVADYIEGETKGGYLQEWADCATSMSKEQQRSYFVSLAKHISIKLAIPIIRAELLSDLKDSLELIIRFMNTPEAKKDITDALRITLRDMMIGSWQSIKGGK